ncbi:SEC-C domain-containing protein [Pseudomonas viridiflava]
MKYGRNEQCFCGSGKKYKHCHLGREQESRVNPWDVSAAVRKDFSVKLCSAPDAMLGDCSGKIVSAHTVPKSGSLNKIARKGHVLAFIPSFENLNKHNGMLYPELIGVGKASTFSGFCSVHDDGLFAPVEKEAFTGSQEQCFLLAYRAYAREIYTKRAAAETAKLHKDLDRGRSQDMQMSIQMFSFTHGLGLDAALRDINHHKPRFEAPLLNDDYSSVRSYIIEIDGPPPVMCSGSFAPEYDFDGAQLQDMVDITLTPHMLSVTSFFGGESGQIVFTWLPEDDPVCIPVIESMERIGDNDLSSRIVAFLFETFENVHISPDWWDAIGQKAQTALVNRMMGDMGTMFGAPRSKKLKCEVPPWAVVSRRRVGC